MRKYNKDEAWDELIESYRRDVKWYEDSLVWILLFEIVAEALLIIKLLKDYEII